MKLMIDIPEDYYKSLQKHGAGSCAENTILSGTILSECAEDCIMVNTQGLDEGIRCAMCTNTMANDRGCDGACRVNDAMYKQVLKVIQDCTVPNVCPKSDKPSGKWEHISYYDGGYGMNETCSNCGRTIHGQIFDLVDKYCPNCGAKMIEPQESEDNK